MMIEGSLGTRDLVAVGARLAAGGLLAVAGVTKLFDSGRFASTLRSFPITGLLLPGESSAKAAAVALAAVEVLAGLAFVLGWQLWVVTPVIIGLLLAFSTGIALALVRNQNISCGCFGSLSAGSVKWTALARNGAIVSMILAGIASTRISLDGVARGETRGGVLAILLLIGSQIVGVAMMLLTMARLRSLPAYVKRVPPPARGTSEVWTGTREITWRRRRAES